MKPVLIQRSSPLMFQHLQLSLTQQPTQEGLFLLALTITSHMEQVTTCCQMLVCVKEILLNCCVSMNINAIHEITLQINLYYTYFNSKFLNLKIYCYVNISVGIGVALGDQFCYVESAAVRDQTFWTFTVGKICIIPSLAKPLQKIIQLKWTMRAIQTSWVK